MHKTFENQCTKISFYSSSYLLKTTEKKLRPMQLLHLLNLPKFRAETNTQALQKFRVVFTLHHIPKMMKKRFIYSGYVCQGTWPFSHLADLQIAPSNMPLLFAGRLVVC